MTSITIRKFIYFKMEKDLETACAYLARKDKDLFHYYAGKAEACRELLECVFGFDESNYTEHIHNMFYILEENW